MNGKTENTKKYIDDIIKDLPDSKYTQRFREELLEHMEDTETDSTDQEDNSSQIKTNIMQKIGDKEVLTESFNAFYRNCLSRLWPIELLIYMAFSFGILLISESIVGICYRITDSSLWFLKLIVFICSSVIVYIFNLAVFNFAAKRLLPHTNRTKGRLLMASSLMILPAILLFQSLPQILSIYTENTIAIEYFIATITIMAIMCIADASAFGIISWKNKNTRKSHASIPYLLLFIFLLLLSLSVPLSRRNPYSLSAPWQFIDAAICLTAIPLNTLNYFIFNLPLLNSLDPATAFKVIALILIVIGTLGIRLFLSTQESSSGSNRNWKRATGIAIFIYVTYILLPFNKTYEIKSELNVPAFEIQKEIEQFQQGPLYYAMKYAQQNGYPTNYMICREGNIFTIEQSTNMAKNYFLIDTNNVKAGETPKVANKTKKELGECIEELSPAEGHFPQGFSCIDCVQDQKFDNSGIISSYSIDYSNIRYNGHAIFNKDIGFVTDVKVSENQEWALAEIGYGNIYLIDLRSLR